MRTFEMTLQQQVRVVVPQQFTDDMRAHAKSEDASEFLKKMDADYPTDDETFTLQVLKNGIRKNVRADLAKLLEQSGLGCTLAPVSVAVKDRAPPPESAKPVLANEIDQALQGQPVAQ